MAKSGQKKINRIIAVGIVGVLVLTSITAVLSMIAAML
ncbi:hypothetical protein CDIFMA2_37070 [Clostridioides difficile]|nr:hypothetical protein CDIFMA2_37070 [Clostridioides difficile]